MIRSSGAAGFDKPPCARCLVPTDQRRRRFAGDRRAVAVPVVTLTVLSIRVRMAMPIPA